MCTKFRVDWSNRCGDIAIFHFFKIGTVLHLGFVMCILNHPRRVFCGIYRCAKFGWNRCSSLDNMQVLIFNEFGLKMPIHAPNGGFKRFYLLNGEQSHHDSQMAPPCAEARHTTNKSFRSVHLFLHSSPFYRIPKNPLPG